MFQFSKQHYKYIVFILGLFKSMLATVLKTRNKQLYFRFCIRKEGGQSTTPLTSSKRDFYLFALLNNICYASNWQFQTCDTLTYFSCFHTEIRTAVMFLSTYKHSSRISQSPFQTDMEWNIAKIILVVYIATSLGKPGTGIIKTQILFYVKKMLRSFQFLFFSPYAQAFARAIAVSVFNKTNCENS